MLDFFDWGALSSVLAYALSMVYQFRSIIALMFWIDVIQLIVTFVFDVLNLSALGRPRDEAFKKFG